MFDGNSELIILIKDTGASETICFVEIEIPDFQYGMNSNFLII